MDYHIFVLSTAEEAKNDMFIIGKYSGQQYKLVNKYEATLTNPIIYFYQRVINYAAIENQIESELDVNLSCDEGWVNFKLSHLRTYIRNIINSDKTIPEYNENITINNGLNAPIKINNQYREDCQYPHSICYDNQIIGGFRLVHELNDNDEMGIDSILILHDFGNELFINLFLDAFFDYLDQHYSIVRNYIINCPEINYLTNNFNSYSDCDSDSVSDHEESYHQSEELRNMFVDCLMNKFQDKYHYYPIMYENDSRDRCECIVVSKIDNNNFKANNVCDFLLLFESNDKIFVHFNYADHNVPYENQLHEKSEHIKKEIFCERKFKVTREKRSRNENSDFKYTSIKIIFDEPITFMSEKITDDICMKFIANGYDYTSTTGQVSEFDSDYRLNKLRDIFSDDSPITVASFGIYKHLYTISGFSYFESKKDYLNYQFDTKTSRYGSNFKTAEDPYSELCNMVNQIYRDFS